MKFNKNSLNLKYIVILRSFFSKGHQRTDKRRFLHPVFVLTGIFLLNFSPFLFWPIYSQFTPQELAEREKWELFLQTAAIIEQEQMETRDAVTEPWKLMLEKEGIKRNAIWKDIQGEKGGFIEGWKYEIAAYRLDKFLELNMIPPTVEKKFRGKSGSCQLWITSKMDVRTKVQKNVPVPQDKTKSFQRAGYIQQAFDNLIGNIDRHMGNVLITEDWRAILIDHSRAFQTEDKYNQELLFRDLSEDQDFIMKELPQAFVEKIKVLDFDLVEQIVGEYLTKEEIKALLGRKKLLLEYIDSRIKRYGEKAVLY